MLVGTCACVTDGCAYSKGLPGNRHLLVLLAEVPADLLRGMHISHDLYQIADYKVVRTTLKRDSIVF